jgi:hypothetical protein
MTTGQRKGLSFVIGILISVVAIWLLFRGINYDKLLIALRQANYWWILPNLFFVVFAMYQRAWRWRVMLLPVKQVAFPRLLAATCIGFMANNILPLRLGEFVRAYSLAYQDREVSKSASLATIFIERMVFDLVALLLIFGGVLAITTVRIPEEMKVGTWFAILIALVGIVMVAIVARRPSQVGNLITRYLFFLPDGVKGTVKSMVLRFSDGLKFVMKARSATSVMLHTLFLWICMGASNYFVFIAFGFDDRLTLETSFFMLVVVSISILIPSSPGFVGVYHAGVILTLSLYGIEGEEANAFALVLHAAQYFPITIMGFYYLKKEHLSLKQLGDEAVEKDNPPAGSLS